MKGKCLNRGTLEERIQEAADELDAADPAAFAAAVHAAIDGRRGRVRKAGQGRGSCPALSIDLSSDGKCVVVHDFELGDGEGSGLSIMIDDPWTKAEGKTPAVSAFAAFAAVAAKPAAGKDFGAIWEAARPVTAADLAGNYLEASKGFTLEDLAPVGLHAVPVTSGRRQIFNPAAAVRDLDSGAVLSYERYLPPGRTGKDGKPLPCKLNPTGQVLGGRPAWVPIGWTTPDKSRRIVLAEGLATALAASMLWPGEQVAACRDIGNEMKCARNAVSMGFPAVVVLVEGHAPESAVAKQLGALKRECPGVLFRLPADAGKTPAEVKNKWDAWDFWDALGRPRDSLSSGGIPALDDLPDAMPGTPAEALEARAAEVLAAWAVADKDGVFKGYRGDDVACVQAILEDEILFPKWGRDTTPEGLVQWDAEAGRWKAASLDLLKSDLLALCDRLGVQRKGLKESINAAFTRAVTGRNSRPPVFDPYTDAWARAGLEAEWDGVDRWDDAAMAMGLDMGDPREADYHRQWVECLFVAVWCRVHLDDPFGPSPSTARAERDILKRAWNRQDGLPTYSVKQDLVFVLVGGQGEAKSTLCDAICGGLRRDFTYRPSDAEMLRCIYKAGGAFGFVQEWGELRGLGDSKANDSKEFISRRTDSLRTLYADRPMDYARRFVLVATTNDYDFLKDKSGHRRFAPARVVDRCDAQWFADNAPQLHAHAKRLALGSLGGGERMADDMALLPGGRRPESFKEWGDLSDTFRKAAAEGWVNEGLGRMEDFLKAMAHALGIYRLYEAEDPIRDALAAALARRMADDGEGFARALERDGFTFADLARDVARDVDADFSRPQAAKALADALTKLGFEKARKGRARVIRWVARPDAADEIMATLRGMVAAWTASASAGNGPFPVTERGVPAANTPTASWNAADDETCEGSRSLWTGATADAIKSGKPA